MPRVSWECECKIESAVFILDVTPNAGVTSRSINYVDDQFTLKEKKNLNLIMRPTMCRLASQPCLPGPAVCLVAGSYNWRGQNKPRESQIFSYLSFGYHRTEKQCATCPPQHTMKKKKLMTWAAILFRKKSRLSQLFFALWYPKLK